MLNLRCGGQKFEVTLPTNHFKDTLYLEVGRYHALSNSKMVIGKVRLFLEAAFKCWF